LAGDDAVVSTDADAGAEAVDAFAGAAAATTAGAAVATGVAAAVPRRRLEPASAVAPLGELDLGDTAVEGAAGSARVAALDAEADRADGGGAARGDAEVGVGALWAAAVACPVGACSAALAVDARGAFEPNVTAGSADEAAVDANADCAGTV
jgi:hypothetical protein